MTSIVQTKGILGGRPRIDGTRIGVHHIAAYVAAGYDLSEIHKAYPHLTDSQIAAALEFHHDQTGQQIKRLQAASV